MTHLHKLHKIILLAFSLLWTINLFSQNWNIINRNYRYNFIKDGSDFIETTIWVDSIKASAIDTSFFLNRIVVDTDTSSYTFNGYSFYSNYNYPQFLQREIIKHESSFEFNSPHRFFIKHLANIGELWIFDSLTKVQAQVVSISRETFLDVTDSIKVIELSSKDTIILSKNYGIIRFDPVYEKSKYKLAGIENLIGKSLPTFHDFFNFSVGDIFEYHGYYNQTDTDPKFIIKKNLIIDKRVKKDTLEYDILMHYHECPPGLPENLWNSSKYALSYTTNQIWQFINTPNHPTNLYNNQLFNIKEFINSDFCDQYYSFSKVIVKNDQSKHYSKTIGSLNAKNYFYITDSINFIFSKFMGLCDEHEITYKEGLGEVYHEIIGFEWNSFEELAAYKIENDTTGIITDDSKLIVGVDELENYKLMIYPNPAQNFINIQLNDNHTIQNVEILGLNGQVLISASHSNSIMLNGLKEGIYIIKIELENEIVFRKFLKL
jgi:hypothetical protein